MPFSGVVTGVKPFAGRLNRLPGLDRIAHNHCLADAVQLLHQRTEGPGADGQHNGVAREGGVAKSSK